MDSCKKQANSAMNKLASTKCSASSAGPSRLVAAVVNVAAAFAGRDEDTAGRMVVKPRGRQGNRAGGKRPIAGGPSTGRPRPEVADVPEVKLSKSKLRKIKRQRKALEKQMAACKTAPNIK